jgi:hypothetical protein
MENIQTSLKLMPLYIKITESKQSGGLSNLPRKWAIKTDKIIFREPHVQPHFDESPFIYLNNYLKIKI